MRPLALALLLTGCMPMDTPAVPAAVGEEGRCNLRALQALVGREGSAELGAEALRLSGAAVLRWKPPGAVVSMDFRTDRLNVELDAAGRVTEFGCG